ncbi:MAG: response regulator transcription factor [Luteolibacter sp.]|uniref:response regulator transcription factor n=1 Tax=Luteolibacter sp. TaxID=1962973 RepID=UPI003264E8C2
MKRITVLLADDHTLVREGLRKILEMERDLEIVGEAEDGRQAVAMVRRLRPEVVLMDIAMPLLNGLEATRQVLKAVPATKVLILSAHSDDAYVTDAAESGARGFLLKQTSSRDLCLAIREVRQGNTFFGASVTARLQIRDPQALDRGEAPGKKTNRLSSREVEVLQLIAEGLPNKQVAAELGVTFKTVDKHRQNLMAKLDIHDIAGLTRYALAEGIIKGDLRGDPLR